ncbi:MAG: PLDc N-terminal domain-containing protein [Candidatus Woesearchaeota archaeon]|nr:PLDc N-terminal domain-containing protein [Candidatus Woesearchaeota archaeon]
MSAMTGLGFGLVIGIFFIILMMIALAIAAFVFWIMMLIDCIKRDFKDSNEKVIWILLMIFLHIFASILYYFIVKAKDKKSRSKR